MLVPSDQESWDQGEVFAGKLLELFDGAMMKSDLKGVPKMGQTLRRPEQVTAATNPTECCRCSPRAGQLVSLIVSHNDASVFQAFLNTMAAEVPDSGKTILLVLDNANWYRSKSLNWHHILPVFMPLSGT